MKIVFVVENLAKGGGIERTLTDKANYLAQQGHTVAIVTYEQGDHPFVFELDSAVKHYDLECRLFTLYRFPIYKRVYKIWQMKRRFVSRWKSFVHSQKPDVVVMTTYADKFRKEIMSVVKDTKIVIESHTAFVHDYQSGKLFRRLYLKRDLHYIKKCDLLLALTQRDADCWRKVVKNVAYVTNPVTSYPENINEQVLETDRIISVGRLHPQKRFDRLIDAFSLISANYPSWHLDIYGGGNDKNELEKLIDNYGLANVITIHSPSDRIYDEYMKSQFLVMSSDYEGLPLVLMEAMACALPVVSTDCPYGPSEIVENGITGLLAEMDAKDLAEKMEWMMTHEEERKKMGQNARKAAIRYKKETVMKEWEQAYLSVL